MSERVVRGVAIESRYDDRAELDLMARVVAAMPESLVWSLAAIWCDSKACACYSVSLRDGWQRVRGNDYPETVARELGALLVELDNGHNGLTVYAGEIFGSERLADVDPWWAGDGDWDLAAIKESRPQ